MNYALLILDTNDFRASEYVFVHVEFQNFILGLGKSGQLSMRNAGVRSLARLSKQLGRSPSPFAAWEAKRPSIQATLAAA